VVASSRLPSPRGPLSSLLIRALAGRALLPEALDVPEGDPLGDGDLQLALAVCYELHYGGFEGVDDSWEWDPDLLRLRADLEHPLERWLLRLDVAGVDGLPVPQALRAMVEADDAPSLSLHLLRHGTPEQYRDYVVQRSLDQLREADPHSWALPRIHGAAKVALAEIQGDEYGGGRPDGLHALMYGRGMVAFGLDPTLDAAWDAALPEMLAVLNVMSYLGLHRRWRGAIVGHLAAYEMTSTQPCRRLGNGLRRLGFGPEATAYFDEHVEADAVHEQVAAHDLCGALVAQQPQLRSDVLRGAHACLEVEARFGAALLERWSRVPVQGAA
jgi:hypothetical protein